MLHHLIRARISTVQGVCNVKKVGMCDANFFKRVVSGLRSAAWRTNKGKAGQCKMLSEPHLHSLWKKFVSVYTSVDVSLYIKTTQQSKLHDVSCSFKCHIHTRNTLEIDNFHRSRYTLATARRLHKPLWCNCWFHASCSVRQPASLCSLTLTLDSHSLSSVSRRKTSDELDQHAAQPSRIHVENSCQVSLKQHVVKHISLN